MHYRQDLTLQNQIQTPNDSDYTSLKRVQQAMFDSSSFKAATAGGQQQHYEIKSEWQKIYWSYKMQKPKVVSGRGNAAPANSGQVTNEASTNAPHVCQSSVKKLK